MQNLKIVVMALILGLGCTLGIADTQDELLNMNNHGVHIVSLAVAKSINYGTIIENKIELRSDPSDQGVILGFLYENDEFRVESIQHNQYLEISVLNSQDVSMTGLRGYVAREFTLWY